MTLLEATQAAALVRRDFAEFSRPGGRADRLDEDQALAEMDALDEREAAAMRDLQGALGVPVDLMREALS